MRKLPVLGFWGYWVILTYLGVALATAGIGFALNGIIKSAVVCLLGSGVCDMFDGTVARTAKRTEREKRFGIQIDSLADIVSFGILPAVIGFALFKSRADWKSNYFDTTGIVIIMSIYVLAALIRLAYYNVTEDELQNKGEKRKYYEGLPVTNVAFIIPVVYSVCFYFKFPICMIYNKMLVLIAVAFVAKVRIPKVRLRYLVALCLASLIVVICILLPKRAMFL